MLDQYQYETIRLVTHYLFIFIALAITSALYSLVFWHLKLRQLNAGPEAPTAALARTKPGSSLDLQQPTSAHKHGNSTSDIPKSRPAITSKAEAHSGGRHPAFLIYAVIYVVCTAPLALGRIATMAGATVPLTYVCRRRCPDC